MKIDSKDIKELYLEVEDLTSNFTEMNAVIFLDDSRWFKILKLTSKPKIVKEIVLSFRYGEANIKKILRRMEEHMLISKSRRLYGKRRIQQCPYEWKITTFGKKFLNFSKSKYKSSQRLVIFRCITQLDSVSFAKIFNKKSGVINNWESGCRSINSIVTAEKYMSYIVKNIRLDSVSFSNVHKGWLKIIAEVKEKRGNFLKTMSPSMLSKAGKKGGKRGCKIKKRLNLIRGNSRKPPTNYENEVIEFLNKNNINYTLHPIICGHCFDFKVNNMILEVEDKRPIAHMYHKVHRMNLKAKEIKKMNNKYIFIAIVRENTPPEIINKFCEEYIVCIFQDESLLSKYIPILDLINRGLNMPGILSKLNVNKSSMQSRFKKLLSFGLIKKNRTKYINQWELTEKGKNFLKDYKSIKIVSLLECLTGKDHSKNNKNLIKLIAMRYWLFVNKSGYITTSKYLNKGEIFTKAFFKELDIEYNSQHLIINNIANYPIKRFYDGFIPPNIIVEIKTINPDSKSAFSLNGGSIFELVGQALYIKDFYPSYRFVAIILGKNKKINKLPEKVNNILKDYISEIYTDKNLKEIKYVI